jgi:acyl-CoA thioesterase-2
MTVIESAWPSHPGYAIDLEVVPGVARAWHGDLLLAESTAAVRLIETDHVHRLYFPEADVKLELFETNDHHSICPFKGEADYWSLTASDPVVEDVFWTYRTPFPEVAGIVGLLGVYHERVRVEIESPAADGFGGTTITAFPEETG